MEFPLRENKDDVRMDMRRDVDNGKDESIFDNEGLDS